MGGAIGPLGTEAAGGGARGAYGTGTTEGVSQMNESMGRALMLGVQKSHLVRAEVRSRAWETRVLFPKDGARET